MRQNKAVTEKKYAAFIEECFHKKTFDIKQMLIKHKVDGSLITTLVSLKLVVVVSNGLYNWITPTLHQNDIDGIIQIHRERTKAYRKNRENKEREKNGRDETCTEPTITEEQAVSFLKSIGGYEIYKVERKQL